MKDPSNAAIAAAITWETSINFLTWAQWPAWAKQDLVTAFVNTVAWYNGGMQQYNGVLPPDPAPILNATWLSNGLGGNPVYDEHTVAWPVYVGHVAVSLASEIYAWVPWSLHNFNAQTLDYPAA